MGTNYYLFRKLNYSDVITDLGVPNAKFNNLGTFDDPFNQVQKLKNGFVYRETFYKTIEELDEVFYQQLHIGKSSAGWHFLLAIYPKYGISNLEDWKKLFFEPNNYIENEYEERVTPEEMLSRITERGDDRLKDFNSLEEYEAAQLKSQNDFTKKYGNGKLYKTYDDMLKDNHAVRGKFGLWAHKPDSHTFATDGTYDYSEGVDFC